MPTKTTKRGGRPASGNPAGVSVKIPARAYAVAKRLAKREQRTISMTIERAIVAYEGSQSK